MPGARYADDSSLQKDIHAFFPHVLGSMGIINDVTKKLIKFVWKFVWKKVRPLGPPRVAQSGRPSSYGSPILNYLITTCRMDQDFITTCLQARSSWLTQQEDMPHQDEEFLEQYFDRVLQCHTNHVVTHVVQETGETLFAIFALSCDTLPCDTFDHIYGYRVGTTTGTCCSLTIGSTQSSICVEFLYSDLHCEPRHIVIWDNPGTIDSTDNEAFMSLVLHSIHDACDCLPLRITRQSHRRPEITTEVQTLLDTLFPHTIVKFDTHPIGYQWDGISWRIPIVMIHKEDEIKTVVKFLQTRTPRNEDLEDRFTDEEEEELVEDNSPHACGVCWSRKRKYSLTCGHVYCGECSKHATTTGKCPTCRQRVHVTRQRVYLW